MPRKISPSSWREVTILSLVLCLIRLAQPWLPMIRRKTIILLVQTKEALVQANRPAQEANQTSPLWWTRLKQRLSLTYPPSASSKRSYLSRKRRKLECWSRRSMASMTPNFDFNNCMRTVCRNLFSKTLYCRVSYCLVMMNCRQNASFAKMPLPKLKKIASLGRNSFIWRIRGIYRRRTCTWTDAWRLRKE